MKKFEISQGRHSLHIETGRMAKQADGSVVLRYADTMVLVTACVSRKAKEGQDFFPLTVEYQERSYAGGKIPGGYFKREGRSTEKEILTSRLIDRPMRPMFPEGFFNEVQVIATVLSADKENNSDIVAMNGASMALMLSGVPFTSPVATARVGDVDGKLILNPTFKETAASSLELLVAVTEQGIIMIEAGANIVSEDRIIEALEFAERELKPVLKLQRQMVKDCNVQPMKVEVSELPAALLKKVQDIAAKEIDRINRTEKTKESRDEAIGAVHEKVTKELVVEGGEYTNLLVNRAFEEVEKDEVRTFITESGIRTDGRKYDEIRAISVEVGLLPRTHGSALFTRGQTQSLGVATLGTSRDEQFVDSIDGDSHKNFMLHYNFPPYSVGEIKMMRGPGRREIGHGALAERGLRAVMPTKEQFPYTLRLV